MIASIKSAILDALSLARLLREAAARVTAAEARAEQSERLFRLLAVEHARTLAARQDDHRKHERELAEEHEQAQRAIRDRDAAEVQRDAWRLKAEDWRRAAEEATALSQRRLDERDAAQSSLNSVLADIAEARRRAGVLVPSAGPIEIVEVLREAIREVERREADAKREAERMSAELRALKSQGGGRS